MNPIKLNSSIKVELSTALKTAVIFVPAINRLTTLFEMDNVSAFLKLTEFSGAWIKFSRCNVGWSNWLKKNWTFFYIIRISNQKAKKFGCIAFLRLHSCNQQSLPPGINVHCSRICYNLRNKAPFPLFIFNHIQFTKLSFSVIPKNNEKCGYL